MILIMPFFFHARMYELVQIPTMENSYLTFFFIIIVTQKYYLVQISNKKRSKQYKLTSKTNDSKYSTPFRGHTFINDPKLCHFFHVRIHNMYMNWCKFLFSHFL